mmetsp:Transcript_42332/g.76805  ORF Transcript_42332/g.76805 Transcript_42332/m.76805 type:complete len:526 (+) Transcript_42332:143-1720(+)
MHVLHEAISPELWGVTKTDLQDFEEEARTLWDQQLLVPDESEPDQDDPEIGPSIYVVNDKLIKPRTLAAGGMSWSLMLHPQGYPCDIFVTHSWAEGVFEFCAKVMQMWPGPCPHGLYVCFLANPQNGDISNLLGDNPYKSPFAIALQQCTRFLVVPNSRTSIYTRLWCVFEIHLAADLDLEVLLPRHPRTRGVVEALSPAWGLFIAAFLPMMALSILVLYHWQADKALPTDWVHYAMWMAIPIASLLFCPCVVVPQKHTAYFLAFILGAFMGARVVWVVDHPVDFLLPGTLVAQGALVLRGFGYIVKAVMKENLETEAALLDVDTVRDATCTSKSDEKTIRGAILGLEDEIDAVIHTLRTVGKYDSAVVFNLERGMGSVRASLGIWIWGVVAGTSFWTLCVGYFVPNVLSMPSYFAAVYICAVVLSITVTTAAWFIGDVLIFATDVLLWSGVIQYLVQFTAQFVEVKYGWYLDMYIISFGVANVLLSIGCCSLFYVGTYASLKRRARREDGDGACVDSESSSSLL